MLTGLLRWWLIFEMRIGNRWPRPDQAAGGALDRLPPDQWPRLALHWLAAGFDSESLRQLAGLQPADMHAAIMLMPEVLRSIGCDPAAADDQFVGRCQVALDIVQRDLDATGFNQYRIHARLGLAWPATVYPALPDGSYWGGGEGFKRDAAGAWLLFRAADLASDTLREVCEIEWPACASHGGDPMIPEWDGEDRVELIDEVLWWRCNREGHPLAPVGQLTAELVKTL